MGKVIAVCISEKKGTQKHPVQEAVLLEDWGIDTDAHAGKWHRQVSLLSLERMEEFRSRGARVDYGAFGENVVISGYDFKSLPIGTRFRIGKEAVVEMTQIGKECHSHCAIYQTMGDCIMPREGVFTRVIKGGAIKAGDEVIMIEQDIQKPQSADGMIYTAGVITVSDKGAKGERRDTSGPAVCEMLRAEGFEVQYTAIVPDEREQIRAELLSCADVRGLSLVITTGGTGFAQRDITPEATLDVIERQTPGFSEVMRAESMKITPNGCLSRGVSGIRGKTLIINLPGSEKAARENLTAILKPLRHGLKMMHTSGSAECAGAEKISRDSL